MIVAQLTNEQAESIKNVEYAADNYFYPINDANDIYIISIEEVEQCDIDWVKQLPLIEYLPKQVNIELL
jgi:hypothetical protein